MKKPLLLMLLVLLLPASALALNLPFFGGDKDKAEDKAEDVMDKEKGPSTFLVHTKSGGTITTNNYTVTDDHVVIMMPSGAIYLDKDMVTSIEEVVGVEEEPVQNIQIKPEPAKPAAKPAAKQKAPAAEEAPKKDYVPRDDNGHDEDWWQARVKKWRTKKEDAEKRYADAESDWNRYNGELANLDADKTADFELTRFQDLRGSARIEMDRAKADVAEADRMLNEVLPDEARKAGAPPGWVR